MKNLIEENLRQSPEIMANLRDGVTVDDIEIRLLKNGYEVRQNTIVSKSTGLEQNFAQLLKMHARDFLKVLSTGRFVPKFSDQRSETQKQQDGKEAARLFEDWIEKHQYHLIADEPKRLAIDFVAKNLLPEANDKGGFNLAMVDRGVAIEKYTPQQIFDRLLGRYTDESKTRLAQMRFAAKIKKEAMELTGLTLEDLKDKSKSEAIKPTIELLQSEARAQPIRKKLPAVSMKEFEEDIQKENAWRQGLPIDPSVWTLSEKTSLAGMAKNYIENTIRSRFEPIENILRERDSNFYLNASEKYQGLNY